MRIRGTRLLLQMAFSLTLLRSTRCWTSKSIRLSISARQTQCFSTSASTHHHSSSDDNAAQSNNIFADDSVSFESMGVTSTVLMSRIKALGLERPTAVQAASFETIASGSDVTIGAETGSGKTLAYLLPLLNEIFISKQDGKLATYDYARALILVPNKELVQQVARMAKSLAGDAFIDDASDTIRLAVMPGGLQEPLDFRPFRESIGLGGKEPPIDLVISTPASVGPLALKPKHIDLFADIQTLVVDEADMLLDGGYLRQLNDVLMGFRRADRLAMSMNSGSDDEHDATIDNNNPLIVKKTQHVFVAATLPDSGLRSVDAYLSKRFPYAKRVTMKGMHSARHYGLAQKTEWLLVEEKKDRLQQLVQLLNRPHEDGGLIGEKVMVFLNSVEDVDNVHDAFTRANVESLPYHAKMTLEERTAALDRFRKYDPANENGSKSEDSVGVLVCTDLASRGLDVPHVSVVVQLQFAGNVVSHLHRMGRCGRAGRRNGRGIVFYGEKEEELVEVVRMAENEHEKMTLEQNVDIDDDEDDDAAAGTVQKAFSRKRGFTKKRKKLRREGETETVNRD
ncbi:hypothetical protein MPSEU_001024200 [Mayamaea pseudoterrestris]|nr:hypothetical protein MPSEU_001024200 [Mayamaea pseudoterrestris]